MKNATIGLRISEAEKQKLELIAANKDIPISQLIREAIRYYLMMNGENKNE